MAGSSTDMLRTTDYLWKVLTGVVRSALAFTDNAHHLIFDFLHLTGEIAVGAISNKHFDGRRQCLLRPVVPLRA